MVEGRENLTAASAAYLNIGMQATADSLRLAVLGSGCPPRLMPGVSWPLAPCSLVT
jgi:hypothetical protein